MFALFNLQKSFIGFSDDIPEHLNKSILKKEIPQDKSDLTKWRWEGDYDGQMVSLNEKPYTVTEKELQDTLFKTIYKDYPIDLQVINVIKQLYLLSYKTSSLLPEFDKMAKTIIHAVDLYEKHRKFYLEQNES
jgi:hypothetical protein